MGIPNYQEIMLPLLKIAGDGETHNIHTATGKLAEYFELSEEEISELLPSGSQETFRNRVGWARTYLKKAELLDYPARAHFRITERGKDVLKESPPFIDNTYLNRFPEFVEFRRRTGRKTSQNDERRDELEFEELTPQEALENAYLRLRRELADELLEYVLKGTPSFFEKLVIDLLVAMGYGGTQHDAARAVGRSGDEGIDGIIDEDRLGLDAIYVQAKRWNRDATVGRPQIQTFVGALSGKKAKKGIFITTSNFSNEARDYAKGIDVRIVLIDGVRLADLMIDYGVGVTTKNRYDIKSVDLDYFGEE